MSAERIAAPQLQTAQESIAKIIYETSYVRLPVAHEDRNEPLGFAEDWAECMEEAAQYMETLAVLADQQAATAMWQSEQNTAKLVAIWLRDGTRRPTKQWLNEPLTTREEAASKAMLWAETMGRSSLDQMAAEGIEAADNILFSGEAVQSAVEFGVETHDWEMFEANSGDVAEAVAKAIRASISALKAER